MASRQEVLMGLKAPAPQGLDTRQVLQALAGASPSGGSASWGYGMRVEDAQREGNLAAQHQREQNAQVQQAVGNALAQDQQLYTRAMQAHEAALAERRLALSEQVSGLEMQLKQAQLSMLPYEQQAARLKAEALGLEVEKTKRMSEMKMPVTFANGQTLEVPLDIASSINKGGWEAMGVGTDANSRKFLQDRRMYQQLGYTPEDAYILARDAKMPQTMLNASKQADLYVKNVEDQGLGYGNVVENGVERPRTKEEGRAAKMREILSSAYSGLSDEGLSRLLQSKGGTQLPPPSVDPTLQLLLEGFKARYSQQPQKR